MVGSRQSGTAVFDTGTAGEVALHLPKGSAAPQFMGWVDGNTFAFWDGDNRAVLTCEAPTGSCVVAVREPGDARPCGGHSSPATTQDDCAASRSRAPGDERCVAAAHPRAVGGSRRLGRDRDRGEPRRQDGEGGGAQRACGDVGLGAELVVQPSQVAGDAASAQADGEQDKGAAGSR